MGFPTRSTFQAVVKALDQKRKDLNQAQTKNNVELDKKFQTVDQAGKDSSKLRDDLENLRNDEKTRMRAMNALRTEIEKLQQKTAEPVEEPNTREELQEIVRAFRDLMPCR